MGSKSLALVSRYRELRRVCCRCRGPYADGHICPDQVRHPGVERFFLALRALVEHHDRERLRGILGAWLDHAAGPEAIEDLIERGAEPEFVLDAFSVCAIWENLPPSEQLVANQILEHAGYPQLQVA